MFLLYNGNGDGSREATLRSQVHPVKWDLIKRHAVRILRQHLYQPDAANTLETLPFELWEAANGFGDDFTVLYAKVPVAKYLEIDQEADTDRSKVRYNYKREMLYCFVTDAMGMGELMCIAEPSNGNKLSFATVAARIGLHQEQDPEYAEKCGVPATDDPHRITKIRNILREMRVKGRLRYHLLDRWSVAA